jgi:hypothetical protein
MELIVMTLRKIQQKKSGKKQLKQPEQLFRLALPG